MRGSQLWDPAIWRSFEESTTNALAAQCCQQFDQLYDGGEQFWFCLSTEALRQGLSTLCGNCQMFASDGEYVTRAFVIVRNVQLEAAHHITTMQRGFNIFVVEQQPQLETGYRGNGLKTDHLLGIALQITS